MNNKLTMIVTAAALACVSLCGCGNNEKKEEADKQSNVSKYQEMAAQRGMSRGGGAGGAGAPGQAAPGAPAGN